MKIETYRGVHLKAINAGCGTYKHFVNGTPWGTWQAASEQAAIEGMRPYVDAAVERPTAYPEYWQPGYRQAKAQGDTQADV